MWIRFCYGEFASYGAALSVLAEALKERCGTLLNKQDREGLARLLCTCPSGCIEVAAYYLHWRKVEGFQRDIEYCFSVSPDTPED